MTDDLVLVCPGCGGHYSADAWFNDPFARKALGIVSILPRPVAVCALPYLSLFRAPDGARGITWRRACTVLSDLQNLVQTGYVQWKQLPARPATPAVWAEAMEHMIARPATLDLPLTNHNLLRKIVYDNANAADRKNETARNSAERRGQYPAQARKEEPATPLDPEYMKQRREAVIGTKKTEPVGIGEVVGALKRKNPPPDPAERLRKYIQMQLDKGASISGIESRLPEKYRDVWSEIKGEFYASEME